MLFFKQKLIIVTLLLFTTSAFGQELICHINDTSGRYREHNCDFEKLVLELRFNTSEGRVYGSATYQFSPIHPSIDSIFLDAPNIHIKQVKLNSSSDNIRFTTNKAGVSIFFLKNKPLWQHSYSLQITYEATPRKGLYFIGWKDPRNLSRKQIWTQGQGIDNRHWFPCYDDVNDKLITETIVTFDKNYTVVSNGNLLSTKINSDSTKTWHYAMSRPHAPYLVMLAIDKYAYRDIVSKNGKVSRQYYYADRPETFTPTYQHSATMMDFLARETGVPYPWETYSNSPVQDFMYGAMENTTATIFGDFYLLDERSAIERPYTATNAHELAHQWFGDYVTEWSGTHHWLHESFATYYSKQFMRETYGEAQYEWNKHHEAAAAIAADNSDHYPVAHTRAGSSRHYQKGSHVIDMLRYVIGDEIFRACIQHFLKKHSYGNVDTHDFWRAFMQQAGINLDWFFDQWIYQSGTPEYTIHYTENSAGTTVYVAQTHQTDSLTKLFKMPVIIEVHYTDGTHDSLRVWISKKQDSIVLPKAAQKKISYVLFDPGAQILKTTVFARSREELLAQAEKATHMIDRYDALVALRSVPLANKRKELIQLFKQEKEIEPKREIIAQLTNDTSSETYALLRMALRDVNFQVRRSVIDNLDYIPAALLSDIEKLLNDYSYITIENTLRKLIKDYPENKARYFDSTKTVMGISKNVRIAWLELHGRDMEAALRDELIDYCSLSYEFRTRNRAMEALERLQLSSPALVPHLISAILSPNHRLSGPALKVAKTLMKSDSFRDAMKVAYVTENWQDWEREKLRQIIE